MTISSSAGCSLEDGAQVVDAAEHGQVPGRLGADDADELVVDPAAGGAERAEQMVEVLALADDDRPPADAEEVQQPRG